MAATAVLTGALLVGDSVRGSLRHLTLARLGRIDELLVVDRFFREELAAELSGHPDFDDDFLAAVPAILFPSATAESTGGEGRRRAAGVTVLGVGPDFWALGDGTLDPGKPLKEGQIILNEPLAQELNAKVGDQVVLRLGKASQVPADSPLGRKTGQIESLAELTVVAIIPAESLGRFSVQPTQTQPRNAYVARETLQEGLQVKGRINAIFVAGKSIDHPPPPDAEAKLEKMFEPRLADLGLTLKHVRRTFEADGEEDVIFDYFSLSSDRMMLDPAAEAAARQAFGDLGAQPVLTYLANKIEKVDAMPSAPSADSEGMSKGIPYSTITAINPFSGGPLVDESGQVLDAIKDDEIVLTSWAAEDQQAEVGDRIRVTYFEPETTHGQEKEASAEFRVKAIVPLTEPARPYTRRDAARFDQRPTPANDPDLTPEVQGITDQASIADWDAPFPFDYKLMRDQDDVYWENHRTTPKAYVSLKTGQRLWGSRFGDVTSFRIPARQGVTKEQLEEKLLAQLRKNGESLGMEFRPIKRQSLAASSGTTPFDALFLILSTFIIAAALMLVWLLFRLGIEQRASEIGTLLALGWTRQKTARTLLIEGGIVASAGAAAGVAAGVGYAWLMLTGLRTWWVGAISSPFLELYWTPRSLLIGFFAGLAVSLLTIWFGLRGLRRVPLRQLMAGEAKPPPPSVIKRRAGSRSAALIAALLLGAAALGILATTLGGEVQAVAFLGSGALLLVAFLLIIARMLRGAGRNAGGALGGALTALAVRNAGRSIGRSITTIALMASAAFLVVAVSSFRLSPSEIGVGGFDLLAESSQPIIPDLNSAAARRDLLGDAAQLEGTTILPLRLRAGDDASCRNLYQPQQPRVVGITPALIQYFDNSNATQFAFAASAAEGEKEEANPWHVLDQPTPADQPVPVILDKNTAMYSLRLYLGVGEEFTIDYPDGSIRFRVAGLLSNSVLQGSLMIGDADFNRLFPQISGYRFFLIRSPAGQSEKVEALLEDRLSDEGFDAVDSEARLVELLAVQNTYISTFQSLGALGLLLGTFGLATVQLRSVLERRKELALLRASGFRRLRLGEMVLLENLLLLLGGLATGTIAALLVVIPHMFTSGANVPLTDLLVMLTVVLLVGLVTGLVAVRATLRAPLVAALRGE